MKIVPTLCTAQAQAAGVIEAYEHQQPTPRQVVCMLRGAPCRPAHTRMSSMRNMPSAAGSVPQPAHPEAVDEQQVAPAVCRRQKLHSQGLNYGHATHAEPHQDAARHQPLPRNRHGGKDGHWHRYIGAAHEQAAPHAQQQHAQPHQKPCSQLQHSPCSSGPGR